MTDTMRKEVVDDIEIVEPPIGELGKRHSTLKRTCLTGCGCIFIFILGIGVAIRLAIGSGPQTIKNVPDNFPKDIPIYDRDTITQITFIPGKYKKRGTEIAALFPKIILSPLFVNGPGATSTDLNNPLSGSSLRALWSVITAPVGDSRDSVQIEWRKMDAEPGFVVAYYSDKLRAAGYDVKKIADQPHEISYSRADGISGTMLAEAQEELRPGTDYALLTVNIPPAANASQ